MTGRPPNRRILAQATESACDESTTAKVILAALLGLAILAHCAGPDPAYADDTRGLVPKGSVIERKAKDGTVTRTKLPASRFLYDRAQVDKANACPTAKAEVERKLAEALVAADQARPPASWVTAVKWGAVGGAIVGAFAAGAVLF